MCRSPLVGVSAPAPQAPAVGPPGGWSSGPFLLQPGPQLPGGTRLAPSVLAPGEPGPFSEGWLLGWRNPLDGAGGSLVLRGAAGQGRWERSYNPAVGSHPPLLIYLFSDGSWEGLAAGAVRKGWEGGGGGREGRRDRRRQLRRAGLQRPEGPRLCWAPPAPRVGAPRGWSRHAA